MAESFVFSAVGRFAGFAMNPIWCQFEYMFFYDSKIETLRDKMTDLEIMEYDMRQSVAKAKRNAEAITRPVIAWLEEVNNLKEQAHEVLESATNSEMQCLFLTCPNLKTRYSLGRKATEKTEKADKLLKEGGTFPKVGEPKPPVQTPYRNPGDFVAFETRISIKKEIMEALKDKDVKIIGICGMAGVGKTTMAKEIAYQVEVDKLFDKVAMAIVSQDQGVTKIQDKLAEALGLEIKEMNNEIVRTERLRDRLGGDAEKSVLIILDDVWECIELGNIGIPLSDDKSLKVLLTSRFEDVCNDMGAQKKFKVDVLNSEESWKLFKEKAKISDNATDVIKCTAEKVARECGGLPLALVTIAKALSTKTEDVWKNALVELQNSTVNNIRGVQKFLYSRIELSYNYLESDEAKSLLLLFSLFPEDFSIAIDDLVIYAWGLKFFRGTETLSATRRRVNSIVDNLKSCYMLLLANNECVKLHDVVRDVCLQIASKEKHAYLSKHGLKEWPKHDNNESYSKIYLTLHEMNQLPSGLEYPNLKVLIVEGDYQSLNIPKDFFENMKDLRVLDFSAMKIQIPSSPSLTNLRTLCLYRCTLKSEISTIGNLKKLEVLSFWGSNLDHYPDDIAELSNLMSLDLRSEHSCPLPRSILVKLKKLEELYMGIVEIRDDELERVYIVQEISSLTGLKAFQISTNNPRFLLQILHVLCIEKLERFNIELTDLEYARKYIMDYYYFRRVLHICGVTDASMLSQPVINSLMWRADHLSTVMRRADHLSLQVLEKMNISDEVGSEYLNGIHPTRALYRLQVIDLGGMPRLQEIDLRSLSNYKMLSSAPGSLVAYRHLWEYHKMESYILFYFECEKDDAEISILSQLTSLDMISQHKLVHITRMFPRGNYIFEKLTVLHVKGCENLSYLFSPSIASSLVALKNLLVYHCGALEEIIGRQEEDNTSNFEIGEEGTTSRIVFPELRVLSLINLGRFRLLSSQNYELVFPSLKSLQIVKCPMMTKFCSRQSAPKLDEVRINYKLTVDISNFMDSEGSIHIREDDKFVNTSNIVEDISIYLKHLTLLHFS